MTAVLQGSAPRPLIAPAWPRALLALAATLALIVLLYRDTAVAMVGIWARSETFQHAFLVLPIVGWLIWRMRDRLAALPPSSSPLWLLPIAAIAFAWLLGDLGEVNAVTQLALVAMLVMAVPAVLGSSLAREMMFPLGFMFFAVPLGEFTMPWLMARTADVTIWALQASGIPVYREGQDFIIPSGAWSVVEACSGVRYLIASVMVGTLFAYVNFRSQRRRLAFVAIACLIPIAANWVRAYLIVLLGHLSGNRLATGVDHIIYGWFFFAIVMGLMFLVGIRWSEPDLSEPDLPEPDQPEPDLPEEAPPERVRRTSTARPLFFTVAALVVVVAALPHQALRMVAASDNPAPVRLAGVAPGASGWRPEGAPPDWTPAFVEPSARFAQTYRRNAGGAAVGLSIAYYRAQGEGHKLVSSVNALVATKDHQWRQVASGTQVFEVDGHKVVARSARLAGHPGAPNANDALRVWQFYWIDDQLIGSDVEAKAWSVVQRLRHGRDDGAAIMVSTPDGPAAEAALTAFLRDNLASITAGLAAAREAR